MIDYYAPNIDLTLLGCGLLANYHLGAIYLLQQIWPQKPYNRICGSSCGGLLGALIVAGVSIDRVLETAVDVLRHLRGFLSLREAPRSIMSLVAKSLERILPEDAHKRCSQTLGLSITRLAWPMSNEFISSFGTRSELLEALVAGCFIPLWSGSLHCPAFRGHAYLDGAYTNNKPRFKLTKDEQLAGLRQVEVCPFAGDCQVSPPAERRAMGTISVMGTRYQVSWTNFGRFKHAMIPYPIRSYRVYLHAGHRDMKNYVLNNRLVKCQQCYFTGQGIAKAGCLACLKLLEKVDSLQVPNQIIALVE